MGASEAQETPKRTPPSLYKRANWPDCEQRRSEAREVRLFGADDGRDFAPVAVGNGTAIRRSLPVAGWGMGIIIILGGFCLPGSVLIAVRQKGGAPVVKSFLMRFRIVGRPLWPTVFSQRFAECLSGAWSKASLKRRRVPELDLRR